MKLELLAFLVLAASIISFFKDEFTRFFKKIWSIKGAPLVLPLLAASTFTLVYGDDLFTFLLILQEALHNTMIALIQWMPFQMGAAFIAQMMCLFILATAPAWALYGLARYYTWEHPTIWATRIYAGLWIFLLILWIA